MECFNFLSTSELGNAAVVKELQDSSKHGKVLLYSYCVVNVFRVVRSSLDICLTLYTLIYLWYEVLL